tara:strand:- start:1829 stop:1972 length:144 start_codon:yes stop_codon:yes gene_type:complete
MAYMMVADRGLKFATQLAGMWKIIMISALSHTGDPNGLDFTHAVTVG